jgi:hypothetical protein
MKQMVVAGILVAASALMTLSLRAAPAPGEKSLKEQLVGTWECTSLELPKGIVHRKLVTPTHFTWTTFDRDNKTVLACAGGTWSVKEGTYTEHVEFATEGHQHLRGNTYTYQVKVKDDEWSVSNKPGGDFDVNEVWKRVK